MNTRKYTQAEIEDWYNYNQICDDNEIIMYNRYIEHYNEVINYLVDRCKRVGLILYSLSKDVNLTNNKDIIGELMTQYAEEKKHITKNIREINLCKQYIKNIQRVLDKVYKHPVFIKETKGHKKLSIRIFKNDNTNELVAFVIYRGCENFFIKI